MKIAIIGAGLSGLTCADFLAAAGHQVQLIDKSRGPGGRMSTRRAQSSMGELHFDHGAQYFTARDPGFQAIVKQWQNDGLAARWPAAGDDALVGVPSMNSPIKAMASRHDISWSMRIDRLENHKNQWRLFEENSALKPLFDAIVLAIPAEQAATLLETCNTSFSEIARQTKSDPCWTVMLAFPEPLSTNKKTIRDHSVIGWAAKNSDKPMRGDLESWVIQATPIWSNDHLEESQEQIIKALTTEFAAELGISLPEPLHAAAHRWRYARSGSAGSIALYDAETGLGVCGDWLLGPRVECAWLSGTALAQLMVA